MEFEIAYFPSATRQHVFQRDRGVCIRCGTDTEKLRRILGCLRRLYRSDGFRLAQSTARQLGFNGAVTRGEFWQADHIVECVRGGWGKGLENFRTLCTPCHKEETARLAAELAGQRRNSRRIVERAIEATGLFVMEQREAAMEEKL
jgi:hypothetical protein